MKLLTALSVLLFLSAARSQETEYGLKAPAGWGGETISLPPGFARDMSLKGVEHIRFAPGMMDADSATFFSYAFVFELPRHKGAESETNGPAASLNQGVLTEEFLKYYRGLCKAVLGPAATNVDTSKFTCVLKPIVPTTKTNEQSKKVTRYSAELNWVEPFATKKPQKLNIEIRIWSDNRLNYVFACVSPQNRDAAIWKQLRQIEDDYIKNAASKD